MTEVDFGEEAVDFWRIKTLRKRKVWNFDLNYHDASLKSALILAQLLLNVLLCPIDWSRTPFYASLHRINATVLIITAFGCTQVHLPLLTDKENENNVPINIIFDQLLVIIAWSSCVGMLELLWWNFIGVPASFVMWSDPNRRPFGSFLVRHVVVVDRLSDSWLTLYLLMTQCNYYLAFIPNLPVIQRLLTCTGNF